LEVKKMSAVNGDTVLEIEVTPNRPDCLNMLGIARETAAVLSKMWHAPKVKALRLPSLKCAIDVLDKKGCPRYIGTLMEGVRIAGSPLIIQKRLTALGMRLINNVVDITNFCLIETGQPLHAFDYDKLSGGRIVVRRAKEGERIVTLDEVERRLDPSVLVIADAEKPVAIAGIMGGKEAEVTGNTRNILLESAYFDPVLIRRASRKLGLSSDSSYRFERGVDYETVKTGADRALSLILDCAHGRVVRRSDVTAASLKYAKPAMTISAEKVNAFLGADERPLRYKHILKRLGFSVAMAAGGALNVKAPSFRGDIRQEVDVIEEIARVLGYDRLPSTLPFIQAMPLEADAKREFRRAIRDLVVAQGFYEVVTYAMIHPESLVRSMQADLQGIKVRNPLSQDQAVLRPSFLPSLLSATAFNINRDQKNLKLFEMGKIYLPSGERETLGLILAGRHARDWRRQENPEMDFYDIKGVIEQTLDGIGLRKWRVEQSPYAWFKKGQGACVNVEGLPVGVLGKVEEGVLAGWDIKQKNVYFAQVDLDGLGRHYMLERSYRPVREYPAISRDVSLAVKRDVDFQQVKEIAFRLGRDILSSVQFQEEYLGEKIPSGCRGMVFSLIYQSSERTLREDEVNALHASIVQAFVSELGAIQR
jgi:phenylalanyl-tRNA synthetase beta chain